jgi:hypothetical protein
MLVACAVVLLVVFFAATGRGGELSREHGDYPPLDLGPVSATDVALLRPPTALWGYNVQVTDEALDRIAQAVHERDATIAYLRQQLADLTPGTAPIPQIPQVPRPASPTQTLPDQPALQVPYGPRPPAAGQPWAGPGPGAVPNPAYSEGRPGQDDLADEDDLVPWDKPAAREDRGDDDAPGTAGEGSR